MADGDDTKVCPFCAETIKNAARRCPFCNSPLPARLRRQEIFTGVGYLIMFGGFLFALAKLAPEDSTEGGRDFARHRHELDVIGLNVNLARSGTTAFDYNVTGFVTNKGEYPWRVREFELSISNVLGVTDIRNSRLSEPFVVQPHGDHAFVFHCNTTITNPITAVRARVADAQDGRKRWDEHN